jgi:hypothetical protein
VTSASSADTLSTSTQLAHARPLGQAPRDLEARQAGRPEVHRDDVRRGLVHGAERRLAVRGLGQDVDPARPQRTRKTPAVEAMIVSDHHAQGSSAGGALISEHHATPRKRLSDASRRNPALLTYSRG